MSWWCRDRIRVPVLLATLPGTVLLPMTAARPEIVPRLGVDASVFASENPFLLVGERRGAVWGELRLQPELAWTAAGGSNATLSADIAARQYSRRFGNFVTGNVSLDGLYRDSDFLSAGVTARVSRDLSIDTLTTTVEAAVDPRSLRTAWNASGFVVWRPDPYSTIRPEISIERSRFADSELLSRTRSWSASLGYSRRISTVTSVGLRGGAMWSDVPGTSSLRTQQLFATVDRKLRSGWRVAAEAGAERSDSRIESWFGSLVTPQRARWRLSGGVEFCRDVPALVACLSSRLSTEASGLGGLQRRFSVRANASHPTSPRGTLTASAEYNRATVQRELLPAIDGVRIEGGYAYRVAPRLQLGGIVQYLNRTLIDGRHVGAAYGGLRLRLTTGAR